MHNFLLRLKPFKFAVLALCALTLQGCYPAVRYEQYYAPKSLPKIDLLPSGSATPWQLSVETQVLNDVVKLSLSTIRLQDSLPAIEIPCQQAHLSTSTKSFSPIEGSTFSSEYNPPRREIPFCTNLYRPAATAFEHPAYTQTGLRYDVVLGFARPAKLMPVTTDSVIDAIGLKVKSAMSSTEDWYEIYIPSLKVEGESEAFHTEASTFRFERRVREQWQMKWFWPLVSKG